jgi:glycosyltransferase involved in cell wall biosynthesis
MVVHANYKNDTRVRREAEALLSVGFDVDVVSLNQGNEPKEEVFNGVKIYRANLSRSKNRRKIDFILEYFSFFFRAFGILTKLFFQNKYKVIVVHNMPNFLVFTTLIPKIFGSKVILDMHDTMPELYALMFNLQNGFLLKMLYFEEKISVWYADFCITVNEPIKQLFQKRNKKDFLVIHNSTDPKTFSKPKNNYNKTSLLKIIYHGLIHERYGLERVLHIMKDLNSNKTNITLEVHGRGSYYDKIKQIAMENDIDEACSFYGEYFPDEIGAYIVKADVGIVPNYHNEFSDLLLPVKMLEYIYLKVPVVCSRMHTAQYYFDDDCVYYFETDDELLQVLKYINENYDETVTKTEEAYKKLECISWEVEKNRYVEFIKTVLSS